MGQMWVKVRVWVLVALAAGLGLRVYFVLASPRLTGDTLIYGDIAKNLIQHHVYGFTVAGAPPRPTLIRVPGYPVFLALCFAVFGMENYQAVLYVQVAVDLATCLFVAGLARRLYGSRAGLVALWMAALCPFTANYVAAALTETLTLFCIAASFYGVARWADASLGYNRWLGLIVAALAGAVLLRPEQGLLAAAVVPPMFWMAWRSAGNETSNRLRAGAPVLVAAVCVMLPLVPWAYRNAQTFHVFQPLAPRFANDPGEAVPLGFQRWYRTWAIEFASTEEVYWNYDGEDIHIADLPDRAFDSQQQYDETEHLLADYNLADNPSPDLDRRFDAIARKRIAADPIRHYVALPAARLANMLLRPRLELSAVALEWWKWSTDRRAFAIGAGYSALNLAYLVIGLAGLARWKRAAVGRWTPLAASMAAYVLLRCALLGTLDNSEPRYTLEFFPILCVWGAALAQRPAQGSKDPREVQVPSLG